LLLPAAFRLLLYVGIGAGMATSACAATLPDWWTAPLGGDAPAPDTSPLPFESANGPGDQALAGVPAGDDAAIDCLAKAIAYEAGNEPLAGRQAVAQVILNRTHHKAFPKTICAVVFQGSERHTGCQFTFTCDGSLQRALSRRTWDAALSVARQALAGQLPQTIGAATHYHANYVAPRWAPSLVRVATIGAHIFYRFPASGGGYSGVSSQQRLQDPAPASDSGFSPWGLKAANVTGSD